MSRSFRGKAGTIYVEKAKDVDSEEYDVWFEDLCILGVGKSLREALEDAVVHTADMNILVGEALFSILAQEAGVGG